MNYFKIIVSVLLTTYNLSVFGQKIDSTRIKIKSNKIEYINNEKVRLSLQNCSIDTMFVYTPLSIGLELEIRKNTKWKVLDFEFPSCVLAYLVPMIPGEILSFDWDQTIKFIGKTSNSKLARNGTYRFKLNFWDKSHLFPSKPAQFNSYSNEIKLK